jgi:hypothetical protein
MALTIIGTDIIITIQGKDMDALNPAVLRLFLILYENQVNFPRITTTIFLVKQAFHYFIIHIDVSDFIIDF